MSMPRSATPPCGGSSLGKPRKYTMLNDQSFDRTLVRKLMPLANTLRDLIVRFGLRAQYVRIMHVRWSGGRIGVGQPFLLKNEPLLPTPKVEGIKDLSSTTEGIGEVEVGRVVVSKINPEYTEEFLRGKKPDGTQDEDVEVFYEIEFLGEEHAMARRRRFVLESVPEYKLLSWTVNLVRAHEERSPGQGLGNLN